MENTTFGFVNIVHKLGFAAPEKKNISAARRKRLFHLAGTPVKTTETGCGTTPSDLSLSYSFTHTT